MLIVGAAIPCSILFWLVVRPVLTFYVGGSQNTTGGEHHGWLARLEKQGPLGRHLARDYAFKHARSQPGVGMFYLLYNRDLFVGMSRADIRKELGTPDEVRDAADIWRIGRRAALRRLRWDKDYSWSSAEHDWHWVVLAAEYEDGAVAKIGNPIRQVKYLEKIQRSPYQTRLKVDVRLEDVESPPPDWLQAKREATQESGK